MNHEQYVDSRVTFLMNYIPKRR